MENLLSQLDSYSRELTKWNRDSFGHVGSEIHKLKSLLKNDKDAISRHHMLGLIREWRKKEEILWWQRARSDYLKYRDASTCWFHSRANMRRAKTLLLVFSMLMVISARAMRILLALCLNILGIYLLPHFPRISMMYYPLYHLGSLQR